MRPASDLLPSPTADGPLEGPEGGLCHRRREPVALFGRRGFAQEARAWTRGDEPGKEATLGEPIAPPSRPSVQREAARRTAARRRWRGCYHERRKRDHAGNCMPTRLIRKSMPFKVRMFFQDAFVAFADAHVTRNWRSFSRTRTACRRAATFADIG